MKKLINRPADVVEEMIAGMAAVYPGLRRLPGHTILVRDDLAEMPDRPVALISGGGSGHEPAHAGYVGQGMLSAAVAGDVFSSPSPDAVLAAVRAVAGTRGAVLIVKNYTGDRLNFGLAAELARAEGIPVEIVLVADDVALSASVGHAGRRGLAGTILVHKVAGAAAAAGASLAEVAAEARTAAVAVRTMGVALSPCTVPAAGRPGFTLGENEIELGLGIHGEPGVRRGTLESADVLVDRLLDTILTDLAPVAGTRVVLLVNNLGATPAMELAIVARRAVAVLEERKLILERVYMGTFLSSLEMAGVSLSVLPVDDRRLSRLDAPTDAPAWPNAAARPRMPKPETAAFPRAATAVSNLPTAPRTPLGEQLGVKIRAATTALIDAAPRLTQMDQVVGDGDLGISLERGARAVQEALPSYPLDDPAATLNALALTLQRTLGGTSGPLYAAFFVRAASWLREGPAEDAQTWAAAFLAGCAAITELGGAMRGERTMLDALLPAAEAFASAVDADSPVADALRAAADTVSTGARATASLVPRCGRSSYLGERALGHADPGAEAVAVWIDALARC
ncbi:MAG TPA: dihydroxyacetone kinase subunit DhaL [Gemmataceae bacterium]|nr:dihydroxyacetone kinase subunit DhaL [Gemmataceae bacterium]